MDPMFVLAEEEEAGMQQDVNEPAVEMEGQGDELAPAVAVVRKKVTPAKSAWMFFMLEVREQVKKEQPSEFYHAVQTKSDQKKGRNEQSRIMQS
jgi:hypothetical protein